MIIYRCDKCKSLTDPKPNGAGSPSEWRTLLVFNGGYGSRRLEYILCPDCQELLKLPKNDKMADFGEQLLELISETAQEAVNP